MKDGNATEMYFKYSELREEVQGMIAELQSHSKTNPSHKHIWQVYQKVIEFENRQQLSDKSLYDSLPVIMPIDVPAGSSQNLLNDKSGLAIINDAINGYEGSLTLLNYIRTLAVKASSATTTSDEKKNCTTVAKSYIEQIELKMKKETNKIQLGNYNSYDGSSWTANNATDFDIQTGLYNQPYSRFSVTVSNSTVSDMFKEQQKLTKGLVTLSDGTSAQAEITNIDATILAMNDQIVVLKADMKMVQSTMEDTKKQILSLGNSLESSLRGIASYYRQMAKFYFSISSKKDIPTNLE